MTAKKISDVVALYRRRLEAEGIPKTRFETGRKFSTASHAELLAHAHYLLDGVTKYCEIPGKEGKTGRHLAAAQMCLSFAGWFTLDDLLSHNRADSQEKSV